MIKNNSILHKGLTEEVEYENTILKINDIQLYKPEIIDNLLHLSPYRNDNNINQLLLDALYENGVDKVFFYNGMMSFEKFLDNPDIKNDKIHDIKYLNFHDLLVISKSEYLEYYDEVPKNLNWFTGEFIVDDLQLLYRCLNCNIKTNLLRFDNYVGIGCIKRFLENSNTLKTNMLVFFGLETLQQRQDFYNTDKMFPSWLGFYHKFIIENFEVQKILYYFDRPYNDSVIWTLEPEKDLLNEEDIRIEKDKYPSMDDKQRLEKMKKTYKEEIINGNKWYFGIVKKYDLIFAYANQAHANNEIFINDFLKSL